MDWIQQWQSKFNKQNGVAPLVRTGGSRHTGLAAPPHRNIQAVKQYEEKLNDKQFLIIYRERKDIKTVNVGFRDMNFLHMTGVKTRLSAQQFYAACLESKLSEYDFEIDNKGKVQQKLMVLPYLAKNQSMHELRVSDEIFEMILVDEE